MLMIQSDDGGAIEAVFYLGEKMHDDVKSLTSRREMYFLLLTFAWFIVE